MADHLTGTVVSYLADVFVNRLYKKAEKRHTDSRAPSSLTRQYESVVADYVKGFCDNSKDNKLYAREIELLHEFYLEFFNDVGCRLVDFIDKFKALFAPEDVHRDLTPRHTRTFLRNMLCMLVGEGAGIVRAHFLEFIVDRRSAQDQSEWLPVLQNELYVMLQTAQRIIQDQIFDEMAADAPEKPLVVSAELDRLRRGLHLLAREKALETARANAAEAQLAQREAAFAALQAALAQKEEELRARGERAPSERAPSERANGGAPGEPAIYSLATIQELVQAQVALELQRAQAGQLAAPAPPPPAREVEGISNFDVRSRRASDRRASDRRASEHPPAEGASNFDPREPPRSVSEARSLFLPSDDDSQDLGDDSEASG